MEYNSDIKEFSCFQGNMVWMQWIFFVFSGIGYGYKGVFQLLMEYDMDTEEFSCFQ